MYNPGGYKLDKTVKKLPRVSANFRTKSVNPSRLQNASNYQSDFSKLFARDGFRPELQTIGEKTAFKSGRPVTNEISR